MRPVGAGGTSYCLQKKPGTPKASFGKWEKAGGSNRVRPFPHPKAYLEKDPKTKPANSNDPHLSLLAPSKEGIIQVFRWEQVRVGTAKDRGVGARQG